MMLADGLESVMSAFADEMLVEHLSERHAKPLGKLLFQVGAPREACWHIAHAQIERLDVDQVPDRVHGPHSLVLLGIEHFQSRAHHGPCTETVARQLEEKQQRFGFTVFAANHRIGMMPVGLVEKSLKLFAEGVFPAFDRPREPVVPQSLAAERVARIDQVETAPQRPD